MRRFLLIAAFSCIALASQWNRSQGQFPGGSGGRGGFGGFDPESKFAQLAQQSGGTDVIDFAKLPAETKDRSKKMAQFMGTQPYPESGTMNKAQFIDFYNKNAEMMKAKGFGGKGGPPMAVPTGSLTPPPGGEAPKIEVKFGEGDKKDRESRDRDRERRDRPPEGPGGWGQPGWGQPGQGGWGSGGWVSREERKEPKDEETPKPTVYRFGKLPKEVPSWFEELDTDKDGQVGLYEWRKAGRVTDDFVGMDQNGDGLLTAEEWIRHSKLALERKANPVSEDGETSDSPSRSRSDDKKDDRKKGSLGGSDRSKKNPFTGK